MSQYNNQFDDNPYSPTHVPNEFQYQQPVHVPDYLVWGILETVFCCLPLGIVGIVYAVMANTEKSAGNYMQALAHANSAKTWLTIGVVGWAVIVVLYILLFLVAAGTGGM